MNPSSALVLWINFQEKRYFLVPASQPLPAGEMLLVSPLGKSQQVDPEFLRTWEIPEAVALAFLQAGSAQIFASWQERLQQLPTQFQSAEVGAAPYLGLPGEMMFIAGLLGIDPEELQRDPQVFLARLKRLALELADFITESISGEADQVARARQRLYKLTANLPTQSIEINDSLETLPEKIQMWHASSTDKEKFGEFITLLRTFAAETSAPAVEAADPQQAFTRLIQNLTTLFAQNSEEEQSAHYQALAHKAVESAVGEIPQFDFKKVWAEYQQQKIRTEPSSGE
ncbi:hypothetical protein TFLX_03011 [Thermoflexales bacterium]|nr:hypothetical protein TFLX_03011 [Thermoflexales bacterium]